MKVSVVIPTHNRFDLLRATLESVFNQTMNKDDYEIIIVDDGSVENVKEYISSCCNPGTANWKVIPRPVGSGNASTPRNEGIKSAEGDYIFFMDSDDYIARDTLENAYAYGVENKSDIVYLKLGSDTGRIVAQRPFKRGSVSLANVRTDHLFRSLTAFKLYKRSFLLKYRIQFRPDISVAEDKLFSCQAITYAGRVSILADKSYYIAYGSDNGEHLSRVYQDIYRFNEIWSGGIVSILSADIKESKKRDCYNAWLNICLEMLRDKTRGKYFKYQDFRFIFYDLHCKFNYRIDLFDKYSLYEDVRGLAKYLLSNDFEGFVNQVRV